MSDLERLIDYCATNGASEYDVARVVDAHDDLHVSYKYTDRGWEVLENGEWKADSKGVMMSYTIMRVVSQACNERALQWQNKVMKGETTDPAFDELRVMALIELALKFRDKSFLRGVMNECKGFFE